MLTFVAHHHVPHWSPVLLWVDALLGHLAVARLDQGVGRSRPGGPRHIRCDAREARHEAPVDKSSA